MCQLVHVTDIRDETLEILEERQNEDGHLMTVVDADQFEWEWEHDADDFPELAEAGQDISSGW